MVWPFRYFFPTEYLPPASTSVESFATDKGYAAESWQRRLLERADTGGDGDGQVTMAEFDAAVAAWRATRGSTGSAPTSQTAEVVAPNPPNPSETPPSEQAYAVLRSELALALGETDSLASAASCSSREGTARSSVVHEHMRICYADGLRIPATVSYDLSASDLTGVSRKDNFRADARVPVEYQSTLADYRNSGFDRGHLRASEFSANQASMDESFLLSNMSPQTPQLNQQAWRRIEAAIREVVTASGGRAAMVSGNLFLDEHEQPLDPSKIRYLQRDGKDRVAIPTHLFTSVRLTLPSGETTVFSIVMPNRNDLPTKDPEVGAFVREHFRSIDWIEARLGEDLFADMPDADEAVIEAVTEAGTPLDPSVNTGRFLFPEGTAQAARYRLSESRPTQPQIPFFPWCWDDLFGGWFGRPRGINPYFSEGLAY